MGSVCGWVFTILKNSAQPSRSYFTNVGLRTTLCVCNVNNTYVHDYLLFFTIWLIKDTYSSVLFRSQEQISEQWGPYVVGSSQLLFPQSGSCQPSGHEQEPSTGLQVPPFLQLQLFLHCKPYLPYGHWAWHCKKKVHKVGYFVKLVGWNHAGGTILKLILG